MLRAIVVGGGIAGLAASIALRRAGHIVHVYERTGLDNEVGAAINVPPNAARFLMGEGGWGLDPVRSRFVKATTLEWCDPFSSSSSSSSSSTEKSDEPRGEQAGKATTKATTETLLSHSRNAARYGAELWLAHRVDLHRALKRLAIAPAEDGGKDGRSDIPVTIHPRSQVVRYDPNAPSITLASGEVIEADVVIGADGIHSVASEAVLGYENETITPAHYNYCYRFLIPASVLDADPETRFWNIGADGKSRIFADNENQRRLVAYVCRDNTIHNFVGLYYDDATTSVKKEDYLATVDKSEVLRRFEGYHPSILAVINKATDIRRWPLLYRPPIPTWRKGKLVLVGDAAHPMLPHQGQGGAQGMEDAVALGIVLRGVSTPEEIEERLDLYQKIRRDRASAIQILSNVGSDQCHLVYEDLKRFLAESDIPTNPAEIFNFNYSYDIVKVSLDAVKQLTRKSAPSSNNKDTNTQTVDNVRGGLSDVSRLMAVH